ncbi:hypothetical protein HGM15179_015241, partial [Zosterops borbonicus]
FICIYPAYLNNKKTIAEGRRIPIDKAVENPTSTEIQDVCAAVGFNVLLEKNKMYPREWNRDVQYRGRVRIQLKQDDGNPCLPQFPTRKSVMLYAAETIPKLKTRTQKMGGSDQSLQQGEGGKKVISPPGRFPPVYILDILIYDMEYPFGQLGSPVLASCHTSLAAGVAQALPVLASPDTATTRGPFSLPGRSTAMVQAKKEMGLSKA